jgi:uncharacterized membrane protein YozB (DUF420 family)
VSIHDLPLVNATLNAIASTLLVAAFICVKQRRYKAHAALMISAVVISAAFLVCYLIYHFSVPPKSIGLPSGTFKTSYLTMLFSHIFLAVVVLPMIVMAVSRAWKRQWPRHKQIAMPTFWIWFYVSVTGVLIYVILYHVVPAIYPDGRTAGALP